MSTSADFYARSPVGREIGMIIGPNMGPTIDPAIGPTFGPIFGLVPGASARVGRALHDQAFDRNAVAVHREQ